MTEVAIKVSNLAKCYQIYSQPNDWLLIKHDLHETPSYPRRRVSIPNIHWVPAYAGTTKSRINHAGSIKQFIVPKLCRAIPALKKFSLTNHLLLTTLQSVSTPQQTLKGIADGL